MQRSTILGIAAAAVAVTAGALAPMSARADSLQDQKNNARNLAIAGGVAAIYGATHNNPGLTALGAGVAVVAGSQAARDQHIEDRRDDGRYRHDWRQDNDDHGYYNGDHGYYNNDNGYYNIGYYNDGYVDPGPGVGVTVDINAGRYWDPGRHVWVMRDRNDHHDWNRHDRDDHRDWDRHDNDDHRDWDRHDNGNHYGNWNNGRHDNGNHR